MPDSAIQCVEVVRAAGPASSEAAEPFLPFLNADVIALSVEPLVMSTQVSEPVTRKTATEEPARWACMNGIEPYYRPGILMLAVRDNGLDVVSSQRALTRAISESASYSNTSRLYRRYGSVYAFSPPLHVPEVSVATLR